MKRMIIVLFALFAIMIIFANQNNNAQNSINLTKKTEPISPNYTPYMGVKSGSDAFGYTYYSTQDGDIVAFDWIEISATGTALGLLDDSYVRQALSFSFPFYGNSYDSIDIQSNGAITFHNDFLGYTNTALPTDAYSGPWSLIAPYWEDLDPSAFGTVYFQDFGTYAVIQFDSVPLYSGSSGNTFEIILYNDGDIKLQYLDINDYIDATVGIQDSSAYNSGNGWYIEYEYNSLPTEHIPADSVAILINFIQYTHDMKIFSIDEPSSEIVSPLIAFNPTITIKNNGLSDEINFWTYCNIDNGTDTVFKDSFYVSDTIKSDSLLQIVYSSFTPQEIMQYTLTAIVELPEDSFLLNDTILYPFRTYDLDVGCDSIISPSDYVNPSETQTIQAHFSNLATEDASFNAYFIIENDSGVIVYQDNIYISNLTAGADTNITFSDWYAPIALGNYTCYAYSVMADDINNSNDTTEIISASSEIIIVEDYFITNYYCMAADSLEYFYLFVTNPTDIFNKNPKFIIMNIYSGPIGADVLDTLLEKINNGSNLILSSWDLFSSGYTNAIFDTMGFTPIGDTITPINFYADDTTASLFNIPNQIYNVDWTDDQYYRDVILTSLGTNGIKMATFESDSTTPAIVINTANTTIFNAFESVNYQADNDGDGILDIIELIENEINLLYTPSDFTSPYIEFTSPANVEYSVGLSAPIIIAFSEPIDTTPGFAFTCTPDPDGWTINWNATFDTLTLYHNNFEQDTIYCIEITDAYDYAGWALTSGTIPNPFYFSTGSSGIEDENMEEKLFYIYSEKIISSKSIIFNYSIPSSGEISINIYNVNGSKIATLEKGEKAKGIYKINWNIEKENIVSGVYLYVLEFDDKKVAGKLTIIK